MRPRPAAVVEDLGAVAPGVLKRVGEDRHRAEVAGLVHLTGEGEPLCRVRYEGEKVTGRNGLPMTHRMTTHQTSASRKRLFGHHPPLIQKANRIGRSMSRLVWENGRTCSAGRRAGRTWLRSGGFAFCRACNFFCVRVQGTSFAGQVVCGGRRPSNTMAKWLRAAFQPLIGIVQCLDASWIARYTSFKADSALGYCLRLRVNFRITLFTDSIAFVV